MIEPVRVSGAPALPVLGRVFLLLGLLGLIVSSGLAIVELTGRHSATTTGRITEMGGGYPRIAFTAQDGRAVQFTNGVRSSFWRRGDQIAVAYDPADPSDAVVNGFGGRWFLAGLAGVIGGVFFLIGLVFWLIGTIIVRRMRAAEFR